MIECVKPYFISQNDTIPITLRHGIGDSVITSVSSIYHEDWNEIPLVTPLSVRVGAVPSVPAICGILDETCSDWRRMLAVELASRDEVLRHGCDPFRQERGGLR